MDNVAGSERVSKLKNRNEMIRYVIGGILSAILNIALFQFLIIFGVDYKISNLITLVVVKLFCYVINKVFVFKTVSASFKSALMEFGRYLVARGMTSVLDFFGVLFLVETMKCNSFVSKCIMAVIVIIFNYIFGKKFVFYKDGESSSCN